MDKEQVLFNELQENIEFYYKDLVAYITYIAQNNYSWSNGRLPGGKTPEDLAQEIILKTLNGDRKSYDPDKASLRKWFWLQAKSVVDALAKSATHRRERELPEEELFPIGYTADPEDELIAKERQAMISKEVDTLLQVADPDLKEIVEAIVLNNCESKPRFLADALGTDVKDIYNRLKRLRRLAKKGEVADE